METSYNISNDVLEGVRNAIGRHIRLGVKRIVQLELRPDKIEERIIVMSQHRAYLATSRVPVRVESSFSFLDISAIESKSVDQMTINLENKQYKITTGNTAKNDVDSYLTYIALSLKSIYPHLPLTHFIKTIKLTPNSRLTTIMDQVSSDESQEVGPCGGFSRMYESACDYHGMEHRAEVIWDIDTIYTTHNSKELRLCDFDHLRARDLIPIVSALTHNTWFTKFNSNGLKLTNDAAFELAKAVERNTALEELKLSNCGLRFDFIQRLSSALTKYETSQITSLDLSHNVIEDRGAMHLAGALNKIPKGLNYLDLTATSITAKGLNKLAEAMNGKQNIVDNLKTLILAENSIRGEDVAPIYTFLAQPTALSHLDLSSTDIPLDMLSGAMVRGCCHTVTHVNLSRNPFTNKRTRDMTIPKSWKQLFASFYSLQSLKLSGCRLPTDAIKDMLIGVSVNSNLSDLDLDLSSNELKTTGGKVLETCIPQMNNVSSLNIADNGFDMDIVTVLNALQKNDHITHLSIGQNFAGIKSRNLNDILELIVQLIQSEDCCIEHLSLADSKLRTDTALIINCLSSNSSVTSLDISGNMMGNFGARMLAKVLQINKTLTSVSADRNNITAQGFEDIATSLQQNYIMKKFALPVADLVNSMKVDAIKTQAACQKIESYLQRNHSPKKLTTDADFRLHQLFLVNPLQNIIGKLVVQIQNIVKKLDTTDADTELATKLVAEADGCRQLLPKLQEVAMKAQDSSPVLIKMRLFFTDLQHTLQSNIKQTVEEMLKAANEMCSTVLTGEVSSELEEDCEEKCHVESEFLTELRTNVNLELYNKISEVNVAVASHISDFVTDHLIDALKASHTTLGYRKRQSKALLNMSKDVSASNDSLDAAEKNPIKRLSAKRKQRPASTFVHEDYSPDGNEDQVSTPITSDVTDSRIPRHAGEPIVLPEINMEQSLTHIVKSRPKRQKVHTTRRPMMNPNNLVPEREMNGEASEAEVASLGGGNSSARSSNLSEIDDSNSLKTEKVKKPSIASKSGISLPQGISNLFGRKKSTGSIKPETQEAVQKFSVAKGASTKDKSKTDESAKVVDDAKPMETTKTDDVAKAADTQSEDTTTNDDTSKNDVEEEEKEQVSEEKVDVEPPKPKLALKPPAGIPKLGFGSDIMSQLKTKQEKMKEKRGSGEARPTVSPKPVRRQIASSADDGANKSDADDDKANLIKAQLRPVPPAVARKPLRDTTDLSEREVKRRSVKDVIDIENKASSEVKRKSSDIKRKSTGVAPVIDKVDSKVVSESTPISEKGDNSKSESDSSPSHTDSSVVDSPEHITKSNENDKPEVTLRLSSADLNKKLRSSSQTDSAVSSTSQSNEKDSSLSQSGDSLLSSYDKLSDTEVAENKETDVKPSEGDGNKSDKDDSKTDEKRVSAPLAADDEDIIFI